MKHLNRCVGRFLCVLGLVIFIVACGGGGGSNNGGQTPPPDNSGGNTGGDNTGGDNNDPSGETEPNCDVSLESIVQVLGDFFPDNLPSWEQLDCYVTDLVRMDNPEFLLLVGDTPPEVNFNPVNPPTFWEEIQSDLAFAAEWPEANLYAITVGSAPPYLQGDGELYTEEEWDQKMRGLAAYGMYLKQLGFRLKVDFFYPPTYFEPGEGFFPVINNADDFLDWWEDVYIPERVHLAQIAELVKAEYFQPWDVEPGQFIRSAGDGWLEDMTPEEQIAVTQQIIDSLYDAVRPEFSGTLIAINYDRYAAVGDHWKQLNFSEWDQVHFALFTEGDVEATQIYLDEQLAGYTEMVERDGLQNWVLHEVTVDEEKHQRLLQEGETFAEIEADIYQAIFDAINNLPPDLTAPLGGVGLTTGNVQSEEAESIVRANYTLLGQ